MTKQERLAEINARCEYNIYNGLIVTDFDEANGEFCVVEGALRPEAMNPQGMAHGGFVYSLCDVAAGIVVNINRDTQNFVTLSGGVNFLHPGRGSKLRCIGRLIKPGRTINVVETSVFDDEERLVARGTFEMFVKG